MAAWIIPAISAAIQGGQAIYNAIQSKKQNDSQEKLINNSDEQFQKNLDEMKRQFDTNQSYLEKSQADNLDFMNRQLASNESIANQNYELQKKYSEKNYDLQEAAFNYQKELNATQMEREDNAIQRQIADYAKAGFSPLAAIGGNGAAAGSMSTYSPSEINAPQYDMSGINFASGQYADMAKQYAALSMTSRQEYMRGRSQLAQYKNSQILGARQALNQMRADMRYKNQSMSTELFNSAVNYRDSLLNREYVREQTSYLKDKHDWEALPENGYRNNTLANAIIGVAREIKSSTAFKDFANALGISAEALKNFAEKFAEDHNKPMGQAILEDNDLSFQEKTALNDASKELYNKPLEECQPWELVNIAEAATKKEDKLGYKIINWFKSKFGKD